MHIGGIQKTTLLDYPGKVACTVFLSGCNFRCPYCHNAGLVLPEQRQRTLISQQELFLFLNKRVGILDGVCITGGEPTLWEDLPELIGKIRDLGFSVKLDTNGSNPRMLAKLMEENLVDYVAMDIKNGPSRYRQTCGGVDVMEQVKESAALLLQGKTEYEFRTTVFKPLHTTETMKEIGQWLHGARQYFLQAYVQSDHQVGTGVWALTKQEIYALQAAVLADIPNTRIRGI